MNTHMKIGNRLQKSTNTNTNTHNITET